MKKLDPSSPLPRTPREELETTGVLKLSTLKKENDLWLEGPLLSKDELSLIESIQEAVTLYGSSIHLSLQVDRKDADVHCTIRINHKVAGKLIIQTDEFVLFEKLLKVIGFETYDSSVTVLRDTYLRYEKGVINVRKLHKPRGNG